MTAPVELIVDLRHLPEVGKKLVDLGVWEGNKDPRTNKELDLALIGDLGDLGAFTAQARSRYYNEIGALERRAGHDFTPLDVLLYVLRSSFALDKGYVPVLGKNRDTVIGYPQHKGVTDPTQGTAIGILSTEQSIAPGDRVQVGVVDTPLYAHPAFEGSIEGDDQPAPIDGNVYSVWAGHATFVAGQIWQKAPEAHIIVKAGLSDNSGEGTSWDAAEKMIEFLGSGIKVLNLSFGAITNDGEPPLVLQRAIERLVQDNPELLIVAAAGNRGHRAQPPLQVWPAAMQRVIAVGAMGADFTMMRPWVDVTAKGLRVDGFYLNGKVRLDSGSDMEFDGFAEWSGTSFAAGTVSGALANELQRGVPSGEALQRVIDSSEYEVDRYVHPAHTP